MSAIQNNIIRNTGSTMDLKRNVVGRVVLRQDLAKELRRIELSILGEIFPEKLSPTHDAALAHREQLKGESLSFAVISKDVDIQIGRRSHFLLFTESENRSVEVTVFGRKLVFVLLSESPHSLLEFTRKFLIAALKKKFYVACRLLVFLQRAQPFHTGAKAAFEVVLEARTGKFAVDL